MRWHAVKVVPSLPARLEPLNRLARNLWFTWNPETIELWRRLDRDLWEEVYHNPVRLLGMLSQERLAEASVNESFLLHMDRVVETFDQYLGVKTPYNYHLEKNLDSSFRVGVSVTSPRSFSDREGLSLMGPDTTDEVYLRYCLEALDSLPTLPVIALEAIKRALSPDASSEDLAELL